MRSPILRRLRWIVLASLATGLVACGTDNDEVQIVPPPLLVRSTRPVSGVTGYTGDDARTLSVDFDRSPGAGNVIMSLFPMPASAGNYGPTGSGRNWTWFDLDLSPDDGAYAWLIDGYRMPRPLVVHFASGDRLLLSGFSGTVESLDPEAVEPEGTVLFALPVDAPFNPLDPSTFVDVRPLARAVTLAVDLDPLDEGPATHRFYFMEIGVGSVVVAVKDTNDDLVYDPNSDWWGFYRSTTSSGAEIVYAADFIDFEYQADVSITLMPPLNP